MMSEAIKTTVEDLPSVNNAGLFMKTKDAAHYLGVSHATVCHLCGTGEIPGVRVGKQWRIPLRWVAEQLGLDADGR